NINLAAGFLPLTLLPYQFVGAILSSALIILWLFEKLKFELLRPNWIDWLLFSLAPLGFLALVNAPNKSVSLKLNLVLLSFILLYYLIRNFVRDKENLLKTAFFFAGSWLIVVIYGFFQVLADKFGAKSFEVMFGRPNSTFAESDWLGIFLCFALAFFLSSISFLKNRKYLTYLVYVFIFLDLTLLILTLSRSAWIGAAAVIIVFLLISLFTKEKDITKFHFRKFFDNAAIIIFLIFLSLLSIYVFRLSKFDIFDRARSAATSEQKITIACEKNIALPETVASTDDLAKFGCRYINLEEIEFYKNKGFIVTEIYRKDPNVMTRSAIYQKSWEIIREHPILGVGFGTITQNLGADERGAGLNESNIFLQVWAGCGILGLIVFITVIGYLSLYSFRRLSPICPLNKIIGCPVVRDDFEKILNIFLILAIISLIIPNLFNAGLLMGLFWLGLAIFISCINFDK
ncbi:O-antigen ligase domain-containing protein, partial [bacterium]